MRSQNPLLLWQSLAAGQLLRETFLSSDVSLVCNNLSEAYLSIIEMVVLHIPRSSLPTEHLDFSLVFWLCSYLCHTLVGFM